LSTPSFFFTALARRAPRDGRSDFDLAFLGDSDKHTRTFAGDPAGGAFVRANQGRCGFSDGLNVRVHVEEIRAHGGAVCRSARDAWRSRQRSARDYRTDSRGDEHDRQDLSVFPPRQQAAGSLYETGTQLPYDRNSSV
jgi:hypothetical protein